MREAEIEMEMGMESALEYIKMILDAETEEEVAGIKEELSAVLRTNGVSEEQIEIYFRSLDITIQKLESENYTIDENGEIVRNENPTQEMVESNAPELTNTSSQANTLAGIGFGVTGAALVACLALKKKVLKNKKNKTL